MDKMKTLLILVCLLAGYGLAESGTCHQFTVWNPATKDTLVHYFSAGEPNGYCWFGTSIFGKTIRWECRKMAKRTEKGREVVSENGQLSYKNLAYYCASRW